MKVLLKLNTPADVYVIAILSANKWLATYIHQGREKTTCAVNWQIIREIK